MKPVAIKKIYKPSKKYLKEQLLGWIDPSSQCSNYRSRNKPNQHYFRASNENGEGFEHLMCELIGWDYNRGRNRQDATGIIGSVLRNVEFKRERPETSKLCGNMQWSINSISGLQVLRDDNMALVLSGIVDGIVAYILYVDKVNNTNILDNRKNYSLAKVPKTWNSIKDNYRLLYINRQLVKDHATAGFANSLLSKREEFQEMFGFSLRKFLGLPSDQPILYYSKDGSISTNPTFSAQPGANTCIEISKTYWERTIKRQAKKLAPNTEKYLHIKGKVLVLKRKVNGELHIRSNIDTNKTTTRLLDLSVEP